MTPEPLHTDQDLLARLKAGSHTAYRLLFEKYWEPTYNGVYKRLKDHAMAEDITQQIFMQLWERRKQVQIDNLPAYLHTAARYSVYRSMEEQDRYVPVDELLESLKVFPDQADARLLAKEFYVAFEALLGEMPPAQRTIFRMRYLDDLSPDQIAEQLRLSPKTVRNQLGRALARFKSLYVLLLLLTGYW